jgi:integrase/recombinase XerC
VLELVYWDAGTARLLPRLLKGRTRGPVFTTHRRPGPGKVLGPRDTCPDTGLARLSYGQARALLDAHTARGHDARREVEHPRDSHRRCRVRRAGHG